MALLSRLVLLVVPMGLVACGGGSETATIPAAPNLKLNGVVAYGAAMVGAIVTATDANADVVGRSERVGVDGRYEIALNSEAKAPFVLTANRTTSAGEQQALVSVAASVTDGDAVFNVTPVTHLIAARLSPSGNPLQLTRELKADQTLLAPQRVLARVDEVKAILAPVLVATSTQDLDPISSAFSVNGEGMDWLLDSISVEITPNSAQSSNIQVVLNVTSTAPDQQLPTLSFNSAEQTVSRVPVVSEQSLLKPGTSAKFQQLLDDINACYALPLSDRVGQAVSETNAVIGEASDLKAQACRTLFVDNDPSTYLFQGSRVGRNANGAGAWSSLFVGSATGTVFSQPKYITNLGSDAILEFTATSPTGNELTSVLIVREQPDGGFALIGDQQRFAASVTSFSQRRQFLSDKSLSYDSTGVSIRIDPVIDPVIDRDDPVISRAVVTTPTGAILHMVPQTGYDFLVLRQLDSSLVPYSTSSNVVRMSTRYLDNDATRLHPKNISIGGTSAYGEGLFFVATNFTDNAIKQIPAYTRWDIKLHLADGTVVSQVAINRSRPMTMDELEYQSFASLTVSAETDLLTSGKPPSDPYAYQLVAPTNRLISLPWSVSGAAWNNVDKLPVAQVLAFGRSPTGVPFNDRQNVTTIPPQASVEFQRCTTSGVGDDHCADSQNIKANSRVNYFALSSSEASGRVMHSSYGLYDVRLPSN